jgi:hypothetical protein
VPYESAGFAAVFSFFLAGLGHIYAGKIKTGLGIAVSCFVILAAAVGYPVYVAIADEPQIYEFFDWKISLLLIAIYFAIWLWSIFSAREAVKKYNRILGETGKPPW